MSSVGKKALFCALFLLRGPSAFAALGGLPFDLDPGSLVSDDVIHQVVRMVGLGMDHRAYEGATPLSLNSQAGFDVGLEATLVKVPDTLFTALESSGFAGGASPVPSLPVGKLNLHKGMGDFVDVGGSFFYLSRIKVFGGDIKVNVFRSDEGPTFAFRFSYTYADMKVTEINISTKTFTPQLLLSKRMDFAEPYLGVGAQYTTGVVDAVIPSPVPLPPGVEIPAVKKTGKAYGGLVFGGVSLRMPHAGLRITIEGAYASAGTSALGTKVGFSF
jgi:hypothetical protein